MKLSIRCISLYYRFHILFVFSIYSVSIGLAPLFTTGFTKLIYSRNLDGLRISSRLAKP